MRGAKLASRVDIPINHLILLDKISKLGYRERRSAVRDLCTGNLSKTLALCAAQSHIVAVR